MKVTMIHGQNHKGSTWHIGTMLARKITSKDQIKEIYLPKDMPHFCTGCAQCIVKDKSLCPHYKELEPLVKKMDEADVLIFTTPVYVYHTTGSMKAFLDHFGYRWMVHRPEESMFQKQAVIIATAAGGGMKSACKDIKDSLWFWGVPKIYQYGIAVAAIGWDGVEQEKKETIKKKTNQMANAIKKNHGNFKPSIKTRAFFTIMRIVQKKAWSEVDGAYWKEKEWTGKKRPWKKQP